MTKQEIESRINELWKEQIRLEQNDLVIYHDLGDIDGVVDTIDQIQAIVDERLELENSNPEIVPKEKEIKIGSVLEMTGWEKYYKVVGLGKTTVRLEWVETDDNGFLKRDSEYNLTLETDGKPFSLRLCKDGSVYKKDHYGKRCKLQVVPL